MPRRLTVGLLQEKSANPQARQIELWGYYYTKEVAVFAARKYKTDTLSRIPFSCWAHRTVSRREMKWNRLLEMYAFQKEKKKKKASEEGKETNMFIFVCISSCCLLQDFSTPQPLFTAQSKSCYLQANRKDISIVFWCWNGKVISKHKSKEKPIE